MFMSSFEASSDLPSPTAFPAGFVSVCACAAAPNNTTMVAIRIFFMHSFSFELHACDLDAWTGKEDVQDAAVRTGIRRANSLTRIFAQINQQHPGGKQQRDAAAPEFPQHN